MLSGSYTETSAFSCAYEVSNCEDYLTIKYHHMKKLMYSYDIFAYNGLPYALQTLEDDVDKYWTYADVAFANTSGNISALPGHHHCMNYVKEVGYC